MEFGLSKEYIESIIKLFETNSKVDEVILFGSRAKGNFKPGSDIDLAVKGRNISFKDITRLGVKLDQLNLPYKIDLLNYSTVADKDMVEHIDRAGTLFYERWKKYKLNEAAYISTGFPFKGNEYGTSGRLKVVRGENVTTGILRWDTTKYWNNSIKGLEKYILNQDDIVIGMDGSKVGQNRAIIEGKELPLILAQRVARVRAKTSFDQKFVWYQIFSNNFKAYVESIHTGTSIPHISQSQLENYLISAPNSIYEQKQISEILSSLDNKIELLNSQNRTLELLAETLFRQWFMEEGKADWEKTTLENHVEVFRGLSYKGSGLTDYLDGLPMHNLNSIFEGGGYKYEGIKFYKGEYRSRHLLNAGDIIVANTEQGHEFKLIGFPAIVSDSFGKKGLFSQHIFKLTPLKSSYLSNEFIYYLLMMSSIREQIISATNGSTVNMLSMDGLQRPSFRLPPKGQVDKFTKTARFYFQKKRNNYNQIDTLTKLRDDLLPKLMTGEMRVKVE